MYMNALIGVLPKATLSSQTFYVKPKIPKILIASDNDPLFGAIARFSSIKSLRLDVGLSVSEEKTINLICQFGVYTPSVFKVFTQEG